MNSERSERLRNTGAGIATVGVFEETVRVRARGEGLELCFEDTEGGLFMLGRIGNIGEENEGESNDRDIYAYIYRMSV